MDKVSVIIPTYNRFKYLLNTIKSVKAQTYLNIEIIVVNDKSIQNEYYGAYFCIQLIVIILFGMGAFWSFSLFKKCLNGLHIMTLPHLEDKVEDKLEDKLDKLD